MPRIPLSNEVVGKTPHLAHPGGGLQGEVWDLREDLKRVCARIDTEFELISGADWQNSVKTRTGTPPGFPVVGDRYLITTGSGVWAGHNNELAAMAAAGWSFTPPAEGMAMFVDDENLVYMYVDGSWTVSPIPIHALVGGLHSVSGLTVSHFLKALTATSVGFAQIQHGDLGGVGANDHHAQSHVLDGADHTVSGLTPGHVMRATGAAVAAFGQAQHGDLGGIGATDHHSNANDPTSDEKGALAGTDGTPSASNEYVTNSDARNSDARTPVAHVLNGALHTVSGLTPGHVMRASGAAAADFAQAQHGDLGGVGANDHHAQSHVLDGADHTVSGLTPGHVMRATGAAAASFGQAQHGDLGGVGATDHHSNANDPSAGEKAALVSTFGSPSATNRYRSETDPAVARCTTANMQLYLDMTGGSDANDGLTLLTPKKTFAAVYALIPQFVLHNVTVNVLGTSTETGTVALERYVATGKVLLVCGGALRTVVADNGGSPWVSDIASAASIGLTTAGWTPNLWNGYFCQITTSPGTTPPDLAVPQERTIHRHDATTLVPVRNYSTSPVVGATFRVVRPTTEIGTAMTLLLQNTGNGIMQVQNFHTSSTSSLRVEKSLGPVYMSHITVASTLTSAGLTGEPVWVSTGSSLTITPTSYNPATWVLKGATTDPQCGVSQVAGTGWFYCSCAHIQVAGSFIKRLLTNRAFTFHAFMGYNVQGAGSISAGQDSGTPVTLLNSFAGGYANSQFGGHATKAPFLAVNSSVGFGTPAGAGAGILFIPALATAIHGIEAINSSLRLDLVAGTGFAGLGVYSHAGGCIQPRPGAAPTITGSLGDFGFEGVLASIQPSVAVPGSGIDTVIETMVIGVAGNAVTLALVADGAGVGNMTRVGTAFTFHYASAVTTVANFEAAVAGLVAPNRLIRIKANGTGVTVLTAPGDTFGATAFTLGSDVAAGGTWLEIESGVRISNANEQVVVKKVSMAGI